MNFHFDIIIPALDYLLTLIIWTDPKFPMHRGTLPSLLLLALASGFVSTESGESCLQTELAKSFNQSVRPCDDLYGHVCVGRAVEKFTLRAQYGLSMDITKILKAQDRDLGTKLILEAMVKHAKLSKAQVRKCRLHGYDIDEEDFDSSENDFKIGNVFGQMIAAGRIEDPELIQITCRDLPLDGSPCVWTLSAEKKKYPTEISNFDNIESEFVLGILTGFFQTLGIEMDPRYNTIMYRQVRTEDFKEVILQETHWEGFASTVKYIVENLKDESDRAEFSRMRQIYLQTMTFGGYGNVLFAHTLYSNKKQLNPRVVEDFQKLVEVIRSEMLDTIGNITLLEEMLRAYHHEFSTVDMTSDCALELLSRAHAVARHKLIYKGPGSVDEFSKNQPSEVNIFDNNAAHLDDKIIFNPGGLHMLNEPVSSAFKMAFVGWTIAHEMFHGLGLLKSELKFHLHKLYAIPHYSDNSQCYVDFYGGDQFCLRFPDQVGFVSRATWPSSLLCLATKDKVRSKKAASRTRYHLCKKGNYWLVGYESGGIWQCWIMAMDYTLIFIMIQYDGFDVTGKPEFLYSKPME
uniref:Peptidase_M13 domain-containing protein n=1 Tax=Steinernema glaseri TaxID=37863 RepID=A0A1I7Y2K8_9BILA